MQTTNWQQSAPGVWRLTIGGPQGLTPLSLMGVVPKTEALEQLPQVTPPFSRESIEIEDLGDYHILSIPLNRTEKLYGTGLQLLRMNQRGRNRYLRVNSDPKQDTGETHAPVPFYISDQGYGVLVDTSRIVTMYCGSTVKQEETLSEDIRDRNTDKGWKATLVSSRVEIKIPSEGADVYLFGGPTLSDVVARYNLFCGGGTLPPKWGLGFWHRVPTLYTDQQVLQEAEQFRQHDMPCDVIGLEPGWHSQSYPVSYEWEKSRFPEPEQFVKELNVKGFRVNLWEHPFVSPKSAMYEELKPRSGSHSVWGGLAPDYSLPEAVGLYKKQHEEQHVNIGVSGYKLDECDGSDLTNNSWMFPAHAQFPSGLDGEQMRQMYGLMFQKMTTELFRSKNRRTYGLVRASNTGASSMPYVLYSDLYDHKQFIRGVCNASFSGLLWTPEVRRARNAEDWVRRMQTVCFSPLAMLNAWGDGTKPWSFPEVEDTVRHYIKLRMRLLPYLYTAFAAYREKGIPPFRAMPFVMSPSEIAAAEAMANEVAAQTLNTTDGAYGKKKVREWDDQYMVGDALLVAPLVEGESEREVLLPSGIWYGLETGERYEGGCIIRIQCGLERIPVFVRNGSVIPMMPALSHVPPLGTQVPLEIIHFGDAAGEGNVYDDDGETFDYETGLCGLWKATVTQHADGSYAGQLTGPTDKPQAYSAVTWRFAQTHL
ncbi:ABC transporter substrate-binding protein [Paenibacillus sp. Soil766]|uniref:glycoside hydrolase family 31 protein n=1 Tax=Paenibacillus sp. Soil766 TaxID=1736404 RepID=UPI000708A7D7|nr:TIM-barrel domain-containing protein [Paenibacillus sp. Soil766]KRE83824.1 ABC transporter substrate-binding protein [Paenibacillus sp. Soil766]